MGYDCDPFEIEAAERILGVVDHIPTPIESMPWEDIPALYQALDYSPTAECLRWMILTMVREDGCTGARKDEIKDQVWTVPKERVKGRVGQIADFRVPLSTEALAVAERQARNGSPYLFTHNGNAPLPGHYVDRLLNRLGTKARPHGMRTSFRTWVQDTEACGWEVGETVLGHKIGGRVERSYARSDLLERRRNVMEAWANFVTGAGSNVVRLRG